MADRLQIYQGALRLLGPSELASLSEDRPEKRKLDAAWANSVQYVLEQGLWNFAVRSVEIAYDEDMEPLFGYDYSYSKPDDWVRTVTMSTTTDYNDDFEEYADEAGYWFASSEPLYVQYISNDEDYGFNVGAWRQSFAKVVEAYLAFECGLPISADRGNRNDLYSLFKERLIKAKTLDAIDERVKSRPVGTLVRSRLGGYGRWRFDRG
jgi:hypothetical protein